MRFPAITLLGLASLLAAALPAGAQNAPGSAAVLENGKVRVKAWVADGRLREDYLAWADGKWTRVATAADGGSAGPSTVAPADGAVLPGVVTRVELRGGELFEEFSAAGRRVVRRVTLCPEDSWLHVTTRLEAAPGTVLHGFVDRFAFDRTPDWTFSPSVGGFVPDGEYKAPLILAQAGPVAFGIVPDVAALDLATLRQCTHALDLSVPGGTVLGVGFVPARLAYHSVFEPDRAKAWAVTLPPVNAYYLLVTAAAEPAAAYREVVRMHWRQFGRPLQRHAAAQQVGTDTPPDVYWYVQKRAPMADQIAMDQRLRGLALFDDWRTEVWKRQSPEAWLEVPLAGGRTGGGVKTYRWGPGPSVYLTAWFNTLRTSTGMALYARRTGNDDLLRRARQTVDLALAAPGIDGAFKCVAVPGGAGKPVLWAAGDGAGASTAEGYLGYDMSWTGYWLLRWRAAELPGGDDVLPKCRALATFLCDRQEPDGMLPTRFAEDGAVIAGLSRTVKGETGPVALFLLELYGQDPDPRWLAAARRGLAFLAADVIPRRQWYDFETFWSCSARTPQLDRRTQQWPANDLALGQAVAAYLACYRVTHEPRDLAQGEALLDYLLLYQQCWTDPLIKGVTGPAMLLGGFTTQNSDAEWSDARQSQFGSILLDYYRTTGQPEYLERGVAALRAQFPVSPCENWAHEGYGTKTGLSSFHWGTGSGMAGIELEEAFLHDGVVDVASGHAVGVNGLEVSGCSVQGAEIRLVVSSPFRWRRAPVFAFRGVDAMRAYHVFVNGADLGSRRGAELNEGLELPVPGPRTGG